MKCIGGPLDGQEWPGLCRYVEAVTEDLRVARYEATRSAYVLTGHYVHIEKNCERESKYERTFVPLTV